jgi:hypothetical protein
MSFSAAGILFQHDTKFLSGWNPSLGAWSGFGGKRRGSETSVQTAFREVIEELFQVNIRAEHLSALEVILSPYDFAQNGSYVVFFMNVSSLFQISVFLEKKGYRSPLYSSFPTNVIDLLEARNLPVVNTFEITHLCFLDVSSSAPLDPYFKSDLLLC